ncbi:hypothetical protein AgCh_000804 [Apium graveolens]
MRKRSGGGPAQGPNAARVMTGGGFIHLLVEKIDKMNRTKLPIYERIGNVPQFLVGVDAVVAKWYVENLRSRGIYNQRDGDNDGSETVARYPVDNDTLVAMVVTTGAQSTAGNRLDQINPLGQVNPPDQVNPPGQRGRALLQRGRALLQRGRALKR